MICWYFPGEIKTLSVSWMFTIHQSTFISKMNTIVSKNYIMDQYGWMNEYVDEYL